MPRNLERLDMFIDFVTFQWWKTPKWVAGPFLFILKPWTDRKPYVWWVRTLTLPAVSLVLGLLAYWLGPIDVFKAVLALLVLAVGLFLSWVVLLMTALCLGSLLDSWDDWKLEVKREKRNERRE